MKYTGLEVAVIGMAVRFPGAANLQSFWQNLLANKESITFFTAEELQKEGVSLSVVKKENYIPAKGIISDIDSFDSSFFNYSPREALIMDPQIRVLHECAWHTLEDGGYNPHEYKKRIGIYAGAASNPYWHANILMNTNNGTIGQLLADKDYVCSRVANKLNLRGPAVFVQTACSTSLVAIHMASRALLTGECEMALAGGVSISIPNKVGYEYHDGMIGSGDGHCRSFDECATGTVPGDGVGLVLLKPLKSAIKANDRIYGVIKGSAINNDGDLKVGYTAPSFDGQVNVIKLANKIARIDPKSISYIESHGTGTKLGDPIEYKALQEVFEGCQEFPCAIGAVKTNIGHLSQAAGVAGFVKAILSLYNKTIPACLHFNALNPNIDIHNNSKMYVISKNEDWNPQQVIRRAGVSAFGIGGTNAHVVLEEFLDNKDRKIDESGVSSFIIKISAKSERSFIQNCQNYLEYLEGEEEFSILDFSYTLVRRKQFFHVGNSFVCKDKDEAISKLEDMLKNEVAASNFSIPQEEAYKTIFMFPGQGSQYSNMGIGFYKHLDKFKNVFDEGLEFFRELTKVDLKPLVFSGDVEQKKIYETRYSQPLLFIFEYSLASVLIDLGIKPDAMIGHSLGEYVAACVAQVFSYKEGIELVMIRGKLMQNMKKGKMLSVRLSRNEITQFLNTEICLAAENAHDNCVISGENNAIEKLHAQLNRESVQCQLLHTSHAFHSYMMDDMLDDFRKKIESFDLKEPKVPFVSNLTGKWCQQSDVMDPDYWVKHLRYTVEFEKGVEKILKNDNVITLEVGPGRALSSFIKRHKYKKNIKGAINFLSHANHNIDDYRYFLECLCQIDLLGKRIVFENLFSSQVPKLLSIPGYAFEQQNYNTLLTEGLAEDQNELRNERENSIDKINKSKKKLKGSELELYISDLFQRTLGVQGINDHDNFFDLGGDSLSAMDIISSVHEKFNVKLSISSFFEYASPHKVCDLIRNSCATDFKDIEPAIKKDYYSLSSAQMRLFIEHQMLLDSTVYNEPFEVLLEGELDIDKLFMAFQQQIDRHESFRTSFHVIGDQAVQKIHDKVDFQIDILDLENDNVDNVLDGYIQSFDLGQPPLFRVGLIKESESKNYLIIDTHHIITDGTSMLVFLDELIQLYYGKELPVLPIQYKDFAEWQMKDEVQKDILKQEEYWLNQLSNNLPELTLPLDFPRPLIRSFSGNVYYFEIERSLTESIHQTTGKLGVSLFMYLISAFYILLSKLCGQEDICIGTAVAGRRHAKLRNVMGMFVNMLVLRNYPRGGKRFVELLDEVRQNILKGFEYQEYPFEKLIDALQLSRSSSRNSLFDVAFVLQNMPNRSNDDRNANASVSDISSEQLKFTPLERDRGTSKFDLTLTVYESKDTLRFKFDYSADLFKKETIVQIANNYQHVLKTLVNDASVKLDDINFCTSVNSLETLEHFDSNDWIKELQ